MDKDSSYSMSTAVNSVECGDAANCKEEVSIWVFWPLGAVILLVVVAVALRRWYRLKRRSQ